MERMLRTLITVIARLSWPASDQSEFLRRIGTYPSTDELLLEAGIALDSTRSLREAGWLTLADIDRLRDLETALGDVQAAGAFAATDLGRAEWQALRVSARAFLMGEEF